MYCLKRGQHKQTHTFPECRWSEAPARCYTCRCSHRDPLSPKPWLSSPTRERERERMNYYIKIKIDRPTLSTAPWLSSPSGERQERILKGSRNGRQWFLTIIQIHHHNNKEINSNWPGRSCRGRGRRVPFWRSYWPACIPNSTCPDCSHTSRKQYIFIIIIIYYIIIILLYWPACNPNSTCPDCSHTSRKQ